MTQATAKNIDKVSSTEILLELINSTEEESRMYYHNMYNYSLYNTSLLAFQMRIRGLKISPCASFSKWNKMGYMVQRGSKSMFVLAPSTFKKIEEDEKTHEKIEKTYIKGFHVRSGVFCQAQTTCKNFDNDELKKIKGFNFSKCLKDLKIKLIDFEYTNGNCGGYATQDREIAINSLIPDSDKIHTLFHEIAHIVLKHTEEGDETARNIKEFEADTTAYLIMKLIGMDSEKLKANTKHYIKNWVGSDRKLNELLTEQRVQKMLKAVKTIITSGASN